MPELQLSNIPIDQVTIRNGSFDVLRLDMVHPEISGNKWFKLNYYLKEALQQQKKRIISFGGAWSNHLLALAAAVPDAGLESTGIIRGEESQRLSPVLTRARQLGMQLVFISREDYRLKKIPEGLISPDDYIVEEGGYGKPGVWGVREIRDKLQSGNYSHLLCACGTGTTLAGLAGPSHEAIGISVLKNNRSLEKNISSLLEPETFSFTVIHDYSFGGYAKSSPELIGYMNSFYQSTGIPSDIVYTGKLFFAINELLAKGHFPKGSRLIAIHTGGLAGNASLVPGTLLF